MRMTVSFMQIRTIQKMTRQYSGNPKAWQLYAVRGEAFFNATVHPHCIRSEKILKYRIIQHANQYAQAVLKCSQKAIHNGIPRRAGFKQRKINAFFYHISQGIPFVNRRCLIYVFQNGQSLTKKPPIPTHQERRKASQLPCPKPLSRRAAFYPLRRRQLHSAETRLQCGQSPPHPFSWEGELAIRPSPAS